VHSVGAIQELTKAVEAVAGNVRSMNVALEDALARATVEIAVLADRLEVLQEASAPPPQPPQLPQQATITEETGPR